jgi:hypothetical protein
MFGAMQGRSYIESTELSVGILVSDALLEGAHRLLRRNGLRSDDIGNLQIQCDIFSRELLASSNRGGEKPRELRTSYYW